jgi:tetratricopeptide (TPR) repeat protein
VTQRYQENRQYRKAIEVLEGLLQRQLDHGTQKRILAWLADLYLNLGNPEQALDNWMGAVSLAGSPDSDAALQELYGRILLTQYSMAPALSQKEEILDQAIEILQQALALEPGGELLGQLHLDLGRACNERRQPIVAASYFRKMLAQERLDKQQMAECYLELGMIELWSNGNPSDAVQLLEAAIELSPDHSPSNWLSFCYHALAWAFLMAKDVKRAIEAGTRALQAVDREEYDYEEALFQAHYTLGAAYEKREHQDDRAIEHYQAALTVKDDPHTYEMLGNLYLRKPNPQQALRMFQSVRTAHMPAPSARLLSLRYRTRQTYYTRRCLQQDGLGSP